MNLDKQTKKLQAIIVFIRQSTALWHFRRVMASVLILSNLIVFKIIIEKVWPYKEYSSMDSNWIRPRQIPVTIGQSISILVLAKKSTNNKSIGNCNDNILILSFDKYSPLKIFTFPKEVKAMLPGQKDPLQLEEIYQLGNTNLLLDVLTKLIRIPERPNRYILLPHLLLQKLISSNKKISDTSSSKTINILNKFSFKNQRKINNKSIENYTIQRKYVEIALMKKLYRPAELLHVIQLFDKFYDQIDTNLTEIEILNLLMYILNGKSVLQVQQLQFRYGKNKFL